MFFLRVQNNPAYYLGPLSPPGGDVSPITSQTLTLKHLTWTNDYWPWHYSNANWRNGFDPSRFDLWEKNPSSNKQRLFKDCCSEVDEWSSLSFEIWILRPRVKTLFWLQRTIPTKTWLSWMSQLGLRFINSCCDWKSQRKRNKNLNFKFFSSPIEWYLSFEEFWTVLSSPFIQVLPMIFEV